MAKNCESCEHFCGDGIKWGRSSQEGSCHYPFPDAVLRLLNIDDNYPPVNGHDGWNCACFKPVDTDSKVS